jgi:hypothetical protein
MLHHAEGERYVILRWAQDDTTKSALRKREVTSGINGRTGDATGGTAMEIHARRHAVDRDDGNDGEEATCPVIGSIERRCREGGAKRDLGAVRAA